MSVRQAIQDVTDRIAARSRDSRRDYLGRLDEAREAGVHRSVLSCGNLAHAFAACTPSEKAALAGDPCRGSWTGRPPARRGAGPPRNVHRPGQRHGATS